MGVNLRRFYSIRMIYSLLFYQMKSIFLLNINQQLLLKNLTFKIPSITSQMLTSVWRNKDFIMLRITFKLDQGDQIQEL